MIYLVAAVAENNVIGGKNDLPWYLPEDLKRFKQLTTGKMVLMGSKTFDSIMARLGKPLPNRTSVVVTRNPTFTAPDGVKIFHDLDVALQTYTGQDIYVIGGGEIFKQTFDKADRLYITHIHKAYEGDVLFPNIEPGQWEKVAEEPHEGFSFAEYQRHQ